MELVIHPKRQFSSYSTLSVKSAAGEKSTGLGLTIVKKIFESHKGTINVDSEVGKGTTFTIQLPISSSSMGNIEELPANAKILLLEDNLILQT